MSTKIDFVYNFKDIDGSAKELRYPLEIPYTNDVTELKHQIVASEMRPIMKFLENSGN